MSDHDGSKAEESEHESEDDGEILEESPGGRWQKRNEEVAQRNVPGIDCAYLAMDTEEGVEVVWNEVQFSERKSYKAQEQKIRTVFDNLTRIDHANIVKFHRYWIDPAKKDSQKTRVIFITEYMSSGSVKKFLNRTKEIHKYKSTKSWKKWCRQILSALSYLHSCDPPIVHGNLTCDTIFIQHNGLLKIGSVAPDAIRNHVKTYLEIHKNLHYFAPEGTDAQGSPGITPAVDIYAFGICALEMALPKTHLVGEHNRNTAEDIEKALTMLEDSQQEQFIRLSISKDPAERPSARELLLHPVLFEVPSLKLLSAHAFVKNQEILPEAQLDSYKQKVKSKKNVLASGSGKDITEGDLTAFDADKFLEDVRNGIYPLTSFALPKPPRSEKEQESFQEPNDDVKKVQNPAQNQQKIPPETRKIIHAQCCFLAREDEQPGNHVIIQIRFEDKMNRQLRCDTTPGDTPEGLASELVNLNFIRAADKDFVVNILEDRLSSPKDHPTYLSDLYAKQLETGDYGPPLESISETNDAVFATVSQTRQVNNNNNSAPSELFHPSSGTLTPDLLSPPISANGELSGRQNWNSYINHEPPISTPTATTIENTTQTTANE